MIDLSTTTHQIRCVTSFKHLVATPFKGAVNALCWSRLLTGDFGEIVQKLSLNGNITAIEEAELYELELSEQGQLARDIILNDWKVLKAHGASPMLNLIQYYDRDDEHPFFPTDVYSFHIDRSDVPTDTFLCNYYGESSEILPNAEGKKKVLVPAIRDELKKLYGGAEEGFEAFLSEHFFDLHYQAAPNAHITSTGIGNLWKLAVDYPESKVAACIHRAPQEKEGQKRLLMIC